MSALVAKKDWDVIEGLNYYRIVLSGVTFKSGKVDQEIWDLHNQVQTRIPELSEKTRKLPLFLYTNKTLRRIHLEWFNLVDLQDHLLDALAKAPKSVDFYNRIHLARIKKREQEVRDAEIAKRNAQAKEAIERALAKLGDHNSTGKSLTSGSKILRLEDANVYWNQRLVEITSLERSSNLEPDEVIRVLQNLQETINDAPGMAQRVKEVEVMFVRLISMHDELSAYGKNLIPQEDLARALITMQDEVPKLWATGNWDKLRRSLNDVSSFVKFYDLPVRSELSMAERRKPGMSRAILMGASQLPIGQMTPLIRSLVSAIDARDRFMRGHSDTVARLVVQTAKRLNWEQEDVEMLEIAALLHDVGKILVPEDVLNKTDPLTPDEWKTIQMHPYNGARIVKSLEPLNRIIPWIYHHQERWDGGGYPDGLDRKSIPPGARIIAIGEAFTVMTTDSPKRKALSTADALGEVVHGSGSQFDPEVTAAFVEAVENSQHEAGEASS